MDTDVLNALSRIAAQRIGGILNLVDQLEQQLLANGIEEDPLLKQVPVLRDKLKQLQGAAERGEARKEEWLAAREEIERLCAIAASVVQELRQTKKKTVH